MRKVLVSSLALCLFNISSAHADTIQAFDVPAMCKNLAIMEAELISTRFDNGTFTGEKYNPSKLTLKTDAGLAIGTIEYLGGDSEDQDGPNAGQYPCDKDPNLCNHLADAGGSFDWARVEVTTQATKDWPAYPVASVVVGFGSRGGCVINSADYIAPQ